MAYNVILLLSRMHIYVTSKFVKVGSKPNSELEVAAFLPSELCISLAVGTPT